MTGLTPYLHFDGAARAALEFYRDVFGGDLVIHSYGDFGRDDGPADAVAHGIRSFREAPAELVVGVLSERQDQRTPRMSLSTGFTEASSARPMVHEEKVRSRNTDARMARSMVSS